VRHDKLRERGVYSLPDEREIVATGCGGGEQLCLYDTQTYESFGLAEYLVDAEGQILEDGKPTGWRLEDLTDTGRTAKYFVLGQSNAQ
jgi:hypothetical protein